MRKSRLLVSLSIAALALLAVLGWGHVDRPARAAEDLQPASVAAEVITSTFSYQGVLREGGQRVSGNREMTFSLYGDSMCTVQVGASQSTQVQVEEGVFTVDLAFAAGYFDGQGLWLQTEVDGTAVGCQPIQPTPYALSLRPGATISGTLGAEAHLLHTRVGSMTVGEGVLGAKVGYRTSLGYPVGLYGYAYEFGAVGLWGVSDSEFGWGVNGVANGDESIGVRGIANAFTSTTYGVYGEANSPQGFAGYFEHTASTGDGMGLAAVGPTGAIITGTDGSGLLVQASGSTGGDDGVRGEHTGGDGVVGFSDGPGDLDNGVIGFTDGGYGVYGFSNASGQYAGYFDGPIRATSCTGCSIAYVSRNTSQSSLQVGDIVQASGVEPMLAGAQQPVIGVAAVQLADQALGVVLGGTKMTMVEPGTDDAKPGPHYGPVGGPAEPGDYLVVVVQGMAQVRVDPAAEVQIGDRLAAGVDGATEATDSPSLGMLLDEPDGDGLAWILVGQE